MGLMLYTLFQHDKPESKHIFSPISKAVEASPSPQFYINNNAKGML
jgi:hypothetical protein